MNTLNTQTTATEINPATFYNFSGSEYEFEKMVESDEVFDEEFDEHFDSAIDDSDLDIPDYLAASSSARIAKLDAEILATAAKNCAVFEKEMDFTITSILDIENPYALNASSRYLNRIVSAMYRFFKGKNAAHNDIEEIRNALNGPA